MWSESDDQPDRLARLERKLEQLLDVMQRVERNVRQLTEVTQSLYGRVDSMHTTTHNNAVAVTDRVVAMEAAVWQGVGHKRRRQR